jgi:hypothetical protein
MLGVVAVPLDPTEPPRDEVALHSVDKRGEQSVDAHRPKRFPVLGLPGSPPAVERRQADAFRRGRGGPATPPARPGARRPRHGAAALAESGWPIAVTVSPEDHRAAQLAAARHDSGASDGVAATAAGEVLGLEVGISAALYQRDIAGRRTLVGPIGRGVPREEPAVHFAGQQPAGRVRPFDLEEPSPARATSRVSRAVPDGRRGHRRLEQACTPPIDCWPVRPTPWASVAAERGSAPNRCL